MNKLNDHSKKVEEFSQAFKAIQNRSQGGPSPVVLDHCENQSNTTHLKSYKIDSNKINFSQFREVILVDPEKKTALIEPRVSMETLLASTLPFGLVPAVLPEFKGITAGGAIMGGAAESSSHQWGCFNDICLSYELIDGKGNLIKVSKEENRDLFFGIAGSYGSLAALVSAEIQLIPAQDYVYLRYHSFSNPMEAIEKIQSLVHSDRPPPLLDGLIFDKNSSVVIEGHFNADGFPDTDFPLFSFQALSAPWYCQHVKTMNQESKVWFEKMTLNDYFFRYDLGAFWMGAYLFKPQFLKNFILEGWLGFDEASKENFTQEEISRITPLSDISPIMRTLLRPLLHSQPLWSLLHKTKQWIRKRFVIQDLCIPESHATDFWKDLLDDASIFPLWLCPIKGTREPQILAPHLLSPNSPDTHFINFGVYGIPAEPNPIRKVIKKLEERVRFYEGRKVLYSDSYYSEEEFWQIYCRKKYEALRMKTHANGVWNKLTDKVL